ncbi:MAG: hypothetical protein ACLGH7_02325, partial [Actinomycetes bacterium]
LETSVEASGTTYINTGTWSSDIRGEGREQTDREAFPYALVSVASNGTTSGGLRHWKPDAD